MTAEGIAHLGTRSIAVAGCGGVGGAHALTMARMGVGRFHLSDPGLFDEPDINRQWGATVKTLGKKKVNVYRQMLLEINPDLQIETFPEGVTPRRHEKFLEGVHLLIDCLDVNVPIELREELHEEARKRSIFIMTAPILGFGCLVVCSSPEGMPMGTFTRLLHQTKSETHFPDFMKKIFMANHLDLIEENLKSGKLPSLAVAPVIATALLATESIAYFLDGIIPGSRKPVVLPKVIFFDLFRMSYFILDARIVLKSTKEGS
ncbi:MAG: ThiF family adenylyltransferase [Candidatus Omnitrophica bacterium]|nr:ThiF family adenylyltransferase [Candidatus Omnitrophota bacterium]